MKLKLAALAAMLAASPAFADTSNGPDPYASGMGFDTPTEASWGGWNRGDANTVYVEWDLFDDSTYAGPRTAAPDLGSSGATDAFIGWETAFKAGSGNLYSFSADMTFQVNVSAADIGGPVRVALQTESWGFPVRDMLLNGVAPTTTATTYTGRMFVDALGSDADIVQALYVWDMASAATTYTIDFGAPVHTSLAQVSVDIAAAPVPEPETYAMLAAGLGLVGWQVRRRNKSAQTAA